MGIIELNRRLRNNLGILVIRHYYALAKSFGRQGQYFLRAKDIDHHLVTMLASFGKRVDDVMVIVRGNWEFNEDEDRQDLVPRQKGEPGGRNDLKKALTSTDDGMLEQIKTMLKFFGCPNLQK
ncbi:hypothetical protein CsSME_00029811 [Camellia sinensis var. sinensis]